MAIECDTELYCSGDIIAADISCGELSCNNGYIEEDISAKIVSFNELLRIGGNAKFYSVNTNGQLEVKGDLTVTNFLDLRAKVLVSGINNNLYCTSWKVYSMDDYINITTHFI